MHVKRVGKFRSQAEANVAKRLKQAGVRGDYETRRIVYVVPESEHTYTPDFWLPSGHPLEVKGRFLPTDRKKHLYIKEQHPQLGVRFAFTNPRQKLTSGGKQTYSDWCNKHGFPWCKTTDIPDEWLNKETQR